MKLSEIAIESLSKRPIVHFEEKQNLEVLPRYESKYILDEKRLIAFLEYLPQQYSRLAYHNQVIQPYHNQYFDTLDYRFYLDHHRGKLPRVKIRSRKYLSSGACFWEIKFKDNNGITLKGREACEISKTPPTNQLKSAINKEIDFKELKATISNKYQRITLVGNEQDPRLTLDFNLQFDWENKHTEIENLVVLECKRSTSTKSEIEKTLQKLKIKPVSFSKYCTGMALLIPGIKRNRFLTFLKKLKLV